MYLKNLKILILFKFLFDDYGDVLQNKRPVQKQVLFKLYARERFIMNIQILCYIYYEHLKNHQICFLS